MRAMMKTTLSAIALSLFLSLIFAAPGSAEDYEALKGVNSLKAVFDFRTGNPDSALIHLQLINDTYKDKTVQGMPGKPDFVVVFMDSSVKLLSSNRDGFSTEVQKKLEEMDKVISAASEAGIRLEICKFAVDFYGVDIESISPEIHRVPNGWISSIGYQAKGYSLVPVF